MSGLGEWVSVHIRLVWSDRLRVLWHGRVNVLTTATPGGGATSEATVPRVFRWPWRRRVVAYTPLPDDETPETRARAVERALRRAMEEDTAS